MSNKIYVKQSILLPRTFVLTKISLLSENFEKIISGISNIFNDLKNHTLSDLTHHTIFEQPKVII